jgi:hypothetical protein
VDHRPHNGSVLTEGQIASAAKILRERQRADSARYERECVLTAREAAERFWAEEDRKASETTGVPLQTVKMLREEYFEPAWWEYERIFR